MMSGIVRPGLPAACSSFVFAVEPFADTWVFESTLNTPVSTPRSTVTELPDTDFTVPRNDSVPCAPARTPKNMATAMTTKNTLRLMGCLLKVKLGCIGLTHYCADGYGKSTEILTVRPTGSLPITRRDPELGARLDPDVA